MTIDEALLYLERDDASIRFFSPQDYEAFVTLKKYVKSQQQPCEDCISREAAKASIQRKIDEVVSKDGSYDYDMKQYIGGLLTAKIAISRNNLPSVTPQPYK